jgi:Uncharacterised nucleotidyltransferase
MSPEFELLLQSIRLNGTDASVGQAEKILGGNEIDWDLLYDIADLHRVKPQLAILTGKISPEMIPAGFKTRIYDAYRQNLMNQLSYVDDFQRVRHFLEEAGIQIIPFKGFWLAHDAYGDLADRESMDVDVFVNMSDLDRIKVLMLENGYTEEKAFAKFTIAAIKSRFQEYNFDRVQGDSTRFHIEFHWGICPPEYGMGIRMEDMRSQIINERFHGQEIRVFTPSVNLLLVLMHHGGKDRFIQLKQVNDIACILKKHEDIDWKWVINEARKYDAEPIIYVGANLAATLTGVSVPMEIRAQTDSKIIESLSKNRIRSMMKPFHKGNNAVFNYNNWLFRMRTRTGFGTRFKITAATGREILMNFLHPHPDN